MIKTTLKPTKIITNSHDNTEFLNKYDENKITIIIHDVVLETHKLDNGKVVILNSNDHKKEISRILDKNDEWRKKESLHKNKVY